MPRATKFKRLVRNWQGLLENRRPRWARPADTARSSRTKRGPGRVSAPARGARPRIVAVVPALNEAPSIRGVVESLRHQKVIPLYRVVVVDNGSTDGTAAIARRAGATVVPEPRRGYGRACKAGILAATEAEVILLLDGDAADDPKDLPRILDPLLRDEADLVVGSRATGVREAGSMTTQQVFGNRLATFLMRRVYELRVSDPGPLRAIRRTSLLALDMQEMSYGWSVEMMVKAARAGYRYREVPVNYRRRVGISKVGGTFLGGLGAGWHILSTVFRYRRWTP